MVDTMAILTSMNGFSSWSFDCLSAACAKKELLVHDLKNILEDIVIISFFRVTNVPEFYGPTTHIFDVTVTKHLDRPDGLTICEDRVDGFDPAWTMERIDSQLVRDRACLGDLT